MYLVGIAGCVFMSFGLGHLIGHPRQWLMSGDVWWTTNSAQYVANGGLGFVYAANPWFSALPGFLILYAPVVDLGGHLGLVAGYPIPLEHPSMWLVAAPFFFVCGATAVLGADYLAATLVVSTLRRRVLGLAIAVLVVAPTPGFAGHPEDLLALALACFSVALLLRGRPSGALIILSLAILIQTWAVLLLPVLVAAHPAGRRLRALVLAVAAPAAMGLVLLALDFPDASSDLLGQPMPNTGQHLPWWSLTRSISVAHNGVTMHAASGSATRFVAVLASIAAASIVVRAPNSKTILLAASISLYARGVFEVEYWPYYLAPAAVFFAVLVCCSTTGSPKRLSVGLLSALLLYGNAPLAYFGVSYSPYIALTVLLSTGALCTGVCFRTFTVLADWTGKEPLVVAGAGAAT